MILRGLWEKITRVFAVFGSVADENASSASKQKLSSKPQACVKRYAEYDLVSTFHVLLCENRLFLQLPRSLYPPPRTHGEFIAHQKRRKRRAFGKWLCVSFGCSHHFLLRGRKASPCLPSFLRKLAVHSNRSQGFVPPNDFSDKNILLQFHGFVNCGTKHSASTGASLWSQGLPPTIPYSSLTIH